MTFFGELKVIFYCIVRFLIFLKSLFKLTVEELILWRKFYVRKNNNKVGSIETGSVVFTHVLPWKKGACIPGYFKQFNNLFN